MAFFMSKPCLKAVTADSMTIIWIKPALNKVIKGFHIFYQKNEDETCIMKQVGVNTSEVILRCLDQCSQYKVYVRVELEDGSLSAANTDTFMTASRPFTNSKKGNKETQADPKNPKTPSEPIVVAATLTSCSLMWEKPFDDDINKYEILFKHYGGKESWSTRDTIDSKCEFIVDELTPNTEYLFKIRAKYSNDGSGPPSNPSQPFTTCAEITNPATVPDELGHEDVEGKSDEHQHKGVRNVAETFGNIVPKQPPEPPRRTRTADNNHSTAPNMSGIPKDVTVTNRDNQIQAPVIDKTKPPTSNSISIKWAKESGVIKHEICYIGNEQNQDSTYKSSWNILEVGPQDTYSITNLEPKTEYVFKVRAFNGNTSCKNSLVSLPMATLPIKQEKSCHSRFLKEMEKVSATKFTIQPVSWITSKSKQNNIFNVYGHAVDNVRTVLVIGTVGSGKTVLINALVNHLLEVQWQNNYRLTIGDNREEQGETVLTSYRICGSETHLAFDVQLVETPGFGNRGLNRDKQEADRLLRQFSKKTLTAVCFVIQASQTRLTSETKFVTSQVIQPIVQRTNAKLVACITFADSSTPPVIAALREDELKFDEYISFNNATLFSDSTKSKDRLSSSFWELGKKSTDTLINLLQ